jgi:uncharacterized DUF497 family protein
LDTELQFGWRTVKAAKNRRKHKVTFEEAATVFADPLFITVIDDEHSMEEERYITIGMSSQQRLLLVAHTERDGQIWIISAREATKKEERFYAEAE